MNLICCLSNCPPLLSNDYIHSSDDDLHQHSNFIFQQKLNSYTERFSRPFQVFYYQKESENTYLIDQQYVSFYLRQIFYFMKVFFLYK
jgi:hypothetical protein